MYDMRLSQLFMRHTPIAGLEIGETHVRSVLLESKGGEKPSFIIKKINEEPIPEGTVADGRVVNKPALVSALKKLFHGEKGYVIMSVPVRNVYYGVFSFPATVKDRRLEEAMDLTIGFQLPINPQDFYLDWEKNSDSSENEILLAAIKKEILNEYVETATTAGLYVAAVEIHPMSFLRVANIAENAPMVIERISPSEQILHATTGRVLRFLRSIPKDKASRDTEREKHAVVQFYAVEQKTEPVVKSFEDLSPVPIFLKHPSVAKNPSAWLIALGAAARGLVPRDEDDLVSLLPIGTEEAYDRQKMSAFAEFWSNAIVGVSLLVTVTFLGAWAFMTSLQESALRGAATFTQDAGDSAPSDAEERAMRWNAIVEKGLAVAPSLPRWAGTVQGIADLTTDGIIIHGLSLPSPSSVMEIRGVARDRSALNGYKKRLTESELLDGVSLPLTNLEFRRDIPFSISFSLKDPSLLFTPSAP